MLRYIRSLLSGKIVNPFPGIVALERQLGKSIVHRIGSNEALPMVQAELAARFGTAFGELARLYPDPSALVLRELVAEQLQVSPNELLFDAGADSLILLALRTVCEPGDVVVTSAGTYPTFKYFAEGLGAQIVEVPYRDGIAHGEPTLLQPDLMALAESARQHQAKLVYLANPDNPTGHGFAQAELHQLRAALPEHCLLLLDEAYIDFSSISTSVPTSIASPSHWPNTVRLRTLSKAYAAAGLRLGYAVAEQEWISCANQLRIHYAVSNVAHAAGAMLLRDRAFKQQLVQQTLALRQQLAQAITAANAGSGDVVVLPSSTNFLALRYRDPATAASRQQRLWAMQAAVHRPPHPALQHLLRVTACPAALAPDIVAALAQE